MFRALEFDGINSRDYGIYITGEAVYNSPERDVELIEIPARNGDIILDKGRWRNITVTYHCGCFGADQSEFATKIRAFRNALASKIGYKRLTDEYNINEYRLGTFITPVEVEPVSMQRAGEFDIEFNCKPQRFLMSGEATQTITSGQDLFNDTPYDAQPVIYVEGYGTLNLGDYKIKLTNDEMGLIEIVEARTFDADEIVSFSNASYNRTDQLVFRNNEARISVYITNGARLGSIESVTNGTLLYKGTNFFSVTIPFGGTAAAGTNTDITPTCTVNLTINGTATTIAIKPTLAYRFGSSEDTMQFSFAVEGQYVRTALAKCSFGGLSAYSSKTILGHPTIVDCEIGEAYKVVDGEYVSLNRYIDLGSDIPVLKSGSNEITFDNTMTSVQIKPNWWTL